MPPQKSSTFLPLYLVGGMLVLFGQQTMIDLPYEKHRTALALVAIGLALVFLGVWIVTKSQPRWLERFLAWTSERLSVKEWQVMCLVLSLPVVIIVPIAAGDGWEMISPVTAVTAWVLAIGLVTAGIWNQPAPLRKPSIHLIALVIGLTTAAFLLRGTLVERFPILLTGDEGSAGMAADNFRTGEWNNLFNTAWYSFPSLYFFIQSLFIQLLGRTTEALRVLSAIAGALTVIVTFFVARAMFGRRAAWFAAVFLAALHFHVHFSRIGLNNIWDGLWYIVTIGALWYGWAKDRRNAYLLAGLSLGLAQYFYPSSRAILAIILGWVILAAIFDRQHLKRAWLNLILVLIVALVVALPLIWHYVKNPDAFMAPLARVGLTREWLDLQVEQTGTPAWKIIGMQVVKGFGAFTYEDLRMWYEPEVPVLRTIPAALFYIGIIFLILRGGGGRIFPLLLWLVAFGVMGSLSDSTPASQRYVAAAPVCALLVGYGLSEGAAILEQFWEKGKRLISVVAILLISYMALNELYFYFFHYTAKSIIGEVRSNGMVAWRLANYLETQPEDTQVVFFGEPYMGYYGIPSIQYLVPEIEGIDISPPWTSPGDPGITSNHLIFIFLPHLADQIPLVQADYPDGQLSQKIATDGETLYWMYQITVP